MGQKEHTEMIDFRWRVASGNQEHPFTPEAMEAIYVYSKGMPREACIIADNSLLAAYLSNKKSVDKDIVVAAFRDRVENIGEMKTLPVAKSKQQVTRSA
jgi:type II secretory pathway predicted ATPase ExeA